MSNTICRWLSFDAYGNLVENVDLKYTDHTLTAPKVDDLFSAHWLISCMHITLEVWSLHTCR